MFLTGFLCLVLSLSSQSSELDSIRTLVQTSDRTEKIDALNALASRLQSLSPNEALDTLTLSLSLSRAMDYSAGEVDALLVRATILSQQRRYELANGDIGAVMDILQETPNKERLVNAYLVKGNHEIRQGNFDSSLEHYLQGLALARELKNQDLEASFLLNVSRCYEQVGKLEEASQKLLEARKIYTEVNDTYRLGQLYINLGVLEFKKHNLGLSLEYNKNALQIFKDLGDQTFISLAQQNIGFAYWSLGENKKALRYYGESQTIREEIGDLYGLGKLWLNKAKVYHSQDKPSLIKLAIESALSYADSINHEMLKKEVHFFRYQYFLGKQQFQDALAAYQQFVELSELLAKKANQNRILELQKQFEFDELSLKNEAQIRENQIQKLQLQERNVAIVGLVLLCLFIGLLLLLQRRNTKVKLKLLEQDRLLTEKDAQLAHSQSESRQNQLSDFSNQLATKEELLLEATKELTRLKTNQLWNKDQAAEFIEKYHESLRLKDWPKFKLYFEIVHPHFFEKLGEQFKNLTLNDQRMLAMIYIKLTSKEMATLLNITPESVGKAKYRLQQKMNREGKGQLEKFLDGMRNA